MRQKLRPIHALACLGLLASGPAQATDRDLTGTWKGIQVCDDSDGGVARSFVTDDRVEISQEGDRLRLRRVSQDGELSLTYEGTVVALADSSRFEAMVSVCDGSYAAREMLRLRRVRVSEDGGGTFDAESLYESSEVPGLRGIQIFGTCKWAYQRISTADPRIPRCQID